MQYNGREYSGFTRFDGQIVQPGQQFIIAYFDGEPDLWLTDGTKTAVESLKRMYYEEWGANRVTDSDIRIFDPAP